MPHHASNRRRPDIYSYCVLRIFMHSTIIQVMLCLVQYGRNTKLAVRYLGEFCVFCSNGGSKGSYQSEALQLRHNLRPCLSDEDSVLEVGGEAAIAAVDCPAIASGVTVDGTATEGSHGLDGNGITRLE